MRSLSLQRHVGGGVSGFGFSQDTELGERNRISDRERHPRPSTRLSRKRLRIKTRREPAGGLRPSPAWGPYLANASRTWAAGGVRDRVHARQVRHPHPNI